MPEKVGVQRPQHQNHLAQFYLRKQMTRVSSQQNNRPNVREILPAIYNYCTPSQWRKLMRSNQPDVRLNAGILPFMLLPGELRNSIYRSLLLTSVPLQLIRNHPSLPDIEPPCTEICPAILRISKQIHDEAAAILYGENTWYVSVSSSRELAHYHASMRREDPTFCLPRPLLTAYLSHITRVVMSVDSTNRTCTSRFDIYYKLANAGIKLEKLAFFALHFDGRWVKERNMRDNKHWLEDVDVRLLRERYVWFREGTMEDEGWVVLKKERYGDATLGRIPGLGIC